MYEDAIYLNTDYLFDGLVFPDPSHVGQRVSASGFGLGTLAFFGPTGFGTGSENWCGIQLDEAVGKNDGAVQGMRYFQCSANHGAFLQADSRKVALVAGTVEALQAIVSGDVALRHSQSAVKKT